MGMVMAGRAQNRWTKTPTQIPLVTTDGLRRLRGGPSSFCLGHGEHQEVRGRGRCNHRFQVREHSTFHGQG